MKLKLDENLPAELLDHLRATGHDVMSVGEQGLAGADDDALLKHVRREERAILTMDKGIANVHVYPPEQMPVSSCSVRPALAAALCSPS